jgi:putative two-component system hydrogenase maturation factor HypX/HoxX
MGNLYGSEYWTYSLPRRVGQTTGAAIMDHRLPLLASEALELGLVDELAGDDPEGTEAEVARRASEWSRSDGLERAVAAKRAALADVGGAEGLDAYRKAELERMRLNFYGFDPSFHVARYNFVHKVASSRTPLYLARHRSLRARESGRRPERVASAG